MHRLFFIVVALGCTAELPEVSGEDARVPDPGPPTDHGGATVSDGGPAGSDAAGFEDPPLDARCIDLLRGVALYRVCRQAETWHRARASCRSFGLDLFVPESLAENDWVSQRAQELQPGSFWIGMNDLDQEGTFLTVDGQPIAYFGWSDGEPNDANGEDCVEQYDFGRWNDRPCDDELPYVCESLCLPTDDEVCADGRDDDCDGRVDEGCPPCRVRERSGQEFLFCDDKVAWAKARTKCLALDGDLAVLDDRDLSRWAWREARGRGRSSWWVGMSDLGAEGDWRWVDGREAQYDGWARGQPDDFGRAEDCLELWPMADGYWNDADCAIESRYICER